MSDNEDREEPVEPEEAPQPTADPEEAPEQGDRNGADDADEEEDDDRRERDRDTGRARDPEPESDRGQDRDPPRDDDQRGGSRSRGGEPRSSLLVRNIGRVTTKEEIRELFESEGEIVDVYLPKDYYTGEQRGFGFVEYKTEAEAENAVRKYDGYNLGGTELSVQVAERKRKRPEDFGKRRGGYGGRRYDDRGRDPYVRRERERDSYHGGYDRGYDRGGYDRGGYDRGGYDRGYDRGGYGRDDYRGGGGRFDDRYDDRRGGYGGDRYHDGGRDRSPPPRRYEEDYDRRDRRDY